MIKKYVGPALVLAVAAIYGVSPVDIVPDVVFPVGWVDDAAVIAAAIGLAVKLLTSRKGSGRQGIE
ncbi:hypothetical protein GCM10025789_07970 [Tessaracoccus lubricantis]|uniref:DUF1232 domain-containing protein n=1 Tax=Tessaracoccus lubricantis TaxID=545543 RepID=A0ABP9F3L1_9ACTN